MPRRLLLTPLELSLSHTRYALMALAALFFPAVAYEHFNWLWLAVAAVTLFLIFVTLSLLEGILNLRSELRLRAAEFLICTCGYDLRPHGESGRCPECGRDYTGATLEREWCAAYPPHSTDKSIRAFTGHCPACDYTLAGLTPDPRGKIRCPECGHASRPAIPPRRKTDPVP